MSESHSKHQGRAVSVRSKQGRTITDYSNLVTDDMHHLETPTNGSHYPRQELWLEIDEDGCVSLGVATECTGNDSLGIWVANLRTLRCRLLRGGFVNRDALRADLAAGGKLSVLIDRIIAGHNVEWDGSKLKGTFTPDSWQALSELTGIDRSPYANKDWRQLDEEDYVWDDVMKFITAETTDAEIDAYLKRVRNEAYANRIALVGGARLSMICTRNSMRDEKRSKTQIKSSPVKDTPHV